MCKDCELNGVKLSIIESIPKESFVFNRSRHKITVSTTTVANATGTPVGNIDYLDITHETAVFILIAISE